MNSNPLPPLAASLYQAIGEHLLPVEYPDRRGRPASRRPQDYECGVHMFPQTWGSTALGFGGIGGQAMTTAYTVVVEGPRGDVVVYFGGRLAYHVEQPNHECWADIRGCSMKEVAGARRKYERSQEGRV